MLFTNHVLDACRFYMIELLLSDIIFIENPDTFPARLSPQEALLSPAQRNRVCTAVLCARVCAALGFRWSRCNANRVCVCRN